MSDRPLAGRNVPGGTVTSPSGAIMRPDNEIASAFAQTHGIGGNAEDLIEQHRSSQNPSLQRASLVQVDAEATAEARSDMKAAAKKLSIPDGTELVDVTVRGNALIGVVEYPNGVVSKVVAGWNDNYSPPKLSPEQAEQQAASERAAAVQLETQRLVADFAQQLDDAKTEIQAELAEEIAKIREDAAKEIDKARGQAEKEQEKEQSSGSRSRSGSRRRSSRTASTSSRGRSGSSSASSSSSPNAGAEGSQLAEGIHSPTEKKGESSGDV